MRFHREPDTNTVRLTSTSRFHHGFIGQSLTSHILRPVVRVSETNLASYSLHLTTHVLHLAYCILHLTPCILRLASCILHLTSCIIHLTSSVLLLTSYTLHPTSAHAWNRTQATRNRCFMAPLPYMRSWPPTKPVFVSVGISVCRFVFRFVFFSHASDWAK